MNTAAHPGDFRAGGVDDLLLRVVHQRHAGVDPLADHGTGGNGTVDVKDFDPVVVLNTCALGVVFAEPDHAAAAVEREHHQVVTVSGVNTPLLVRCDEVQRNFLVAVGLDVVNAGGGFQVDRRPVAAEAFAKRRHPGVVHVELLTTGQGAPWDHLVHVGVTGVVRHRFTLNTAPGGRADDLAWLGLDVAEANFFVFAVQRQVGVVDAGLFAQRLPGLHGDMAVGFGGQLQHHFAGIDVGLDLGHTAGHAGIGGQAIELTQLGHFNLGIPVDPLAAIAHLVHQWPQGDKALVNVGVIALDHHHVGRRFARNQLNLATLPVLHAKGLCQLGGGVVHQR